MAHCFNMLWRGLLACVLVAALFLAGCGLEGKTLVSVDDKDTGAKVAVVARSGLDQTRVHLQVVRKGKEQNLVICDKIELHDVGLLRYNDWFLVVSGPYVIGGYDADGDRIVPMNSDALPFTYRTLSGYVIAEKHLSDGEFAVPSDFVVRKDRP